MVVRRPGKVCGDCADLSMVLVLLTPNAFKLQHNVLDLRIKDEPRYIISYDNARSKPQNKQSKVYLSQQLSQQKPI